MIEPIGKGGFATVYKMERKEDKKIFAIKLIKKSSLKNRKQVRYLKNEISVLRKLNHSNIVKTYEVHELDIYVAIVQELLKGNTLRRFYKEGKVREYDAVQIMYQIYSALYYCHKLNIIHRDLKPGNIMLREINPNGQYFCSKYQVVLIDFGLCAYSDDFSPTSFLIDRSGTVGLSSSRINRATEF